MALVDALGAALAHEPWPPILLERAAASGRVRAFALEHAAGVRAKPRHALRLPTALRQARHLQSKERRLVTEALYDLIRWRGLYALVLGTDALDAHWLAWLTTQGLPPGPNGYNALVDLQGLGARLEALAPLDALQAVLGGDRAFTAAVRRSLGNEAMAFCLASQRRGPTVLRAHAGRGSQGALLSALRAEGVEAEPTPYASHGVRVLQRANLVGSRGFKEGLFEVQDEGSQLIAELVDPTAQTVLDLCAGAGGKSLAILAASGSAVTACDVRPAALQALRKRAERAQTPVETLELGPDGDPPRALAGRQFDSVLVDAPCSGSGTLRGQPHLRWTSGERLDGFPPLQARILARAAERVAPGGQLIYATCSVLGPENEAVVADFLEHHPAFALEPLAQRLGPRAAAVGGELLRMTPQGHGGDGFFAATLRRH